MSKYSDFMGYARKAVNRDIYMWGGGQPLRTLSQLNSNLIRECETSTANANRVLNMWNKRKSIYPDAYAADCSGGIIYCLMLAGIVSKDFDTTANGLLNKCVRLNSRKDLRAGDWVGQKSGSNTFHIGIVDAVDANGQIWIIEWRGRDYGCVRTKIENGAHEWNRYGRPDWAYIADGNTETHGDITSELAPVAGTWNITRELQLETPYMRGYDVHMVQSALIHKGYSCGSTGADGIFGGGTKRAVIKFQTANKLHADGIVGEKTVKALGGIYGNIKPPQTPTATATATSNSENDLYAYKTLANAATYKFEGNVAADVTVTLESYLAGDHYARVRNAQGIKYIIPWADLTKA